MIAMLNTIVSSGFCPSISKHYKANPDLIKRLFERALKDKDSLSDKLNMIDKIEKALRNKNVLRRI